MKLADLESALFERFPASDAEPWDHVGLSVGDPAREVRRAYIALDATAGTVERASAAGADVLVAHHPVYLSAPGAFSPDPAPATPQAAAAVYRAASHGVAVISMHTNLDRSREARGRLCGLLGIDMASSLEYPDDPSRTGFGAWGAAPVATFGELVRRCADALGGAPRAWGDAASPISRVAVSSGSLGDLGGSALACGCDTVVCGEAGYHVCQDLCARGCSVVLVGHDVSELPFRSVLADALLDAGFAREQLIMSDERPGWWTLAEEGGCR